MLVVVRRPNPRGRATREAYYKKTRGAAKRERARKIMLKHGITRVPNWLQNQAPINGVPDFIFGKRFIVQTIVRANGKVVRYYIADGYRFNSRVKAVLFVIRFYSITLLRTVHHAQAIFTPLDTIAERRLKINYARAHLAVEDTLDNIANNHGTNIAEMKANGHVVHNM